MPRKAIRINAAPPSDEVAAQYLDFWVQGDLYRHPERFPPLTSEQFFGNARPLALEVGPGTAEWLISMAAQQPGWNFLGIDVYPKALYKAVASAHEAALTNIRFIRAPIQFTYPLFQPESLAALYLHYPDPNLRNRDQHKIVNPAFFDVAARALVLGGTLSLGRTNAFFLGGGRAMLNALYRTAESLGVTVAYVAAAELTKRWFYRHG